nr:hypothetical protein [Ramlibacter aurantiacus]
MIIALVILVLIGLGAATAMRMAGSARQVSSNMRQEALAQQYAELALSYCESELQKAQREPGFEDTDLSTTAGIGAGTWRKPAAWTSTGIGAAKDVPGTLVSGSQPPKKNPQCFVELLQVAGAVNTVYLVTARGFSAGYDAEPDGRTKAGAVVWLQSILALQ